MKKYFLVIILLLPFLSACSSDPETLKADRISYRWEIYDVNFTYPRDFTIIENRQIIFNNRPFDAIIMTAKSSANNMDAGLEIEVMAQDNAKVENILASLDEAIDYEDQGMYPVGPYEYRKICYELSGFPRCSYLIEQNRKYYQFNLDDEYRDEFLKSVAFVE